jgi:succinyl-CoA synthetase alpha subunit
MIDLGTTVVAGVTPGKGGQQVHGVPIYNTVRQAVDETHANASVLFVPPEFCKDKEFCL